MGEKEGGRLRGKGNGNENQRIIDARHSIIIMT